MFHTLFYLSLLLSVSDILAGGSWDYTGEHGPSHWYDSSPMCGLKSQSPIDIRPCSQATLIKSFFPLVLHHYDDTLGPQVLSNNGHTVQLTVSGGYQLAAEADLPSIFRLVQFHMHWGSTNTQGSEHTVDGRAYPLEIHFVHYNTKYTDIGEALKHADGLAVLGVFVEVGANTHPMFDKVVKALSDVKYSGSQTNVDSIKLADLLPSNKDKFIRYNGSLTTPTCNEVVTWTVFDQPIKISQAQLDAFRTVSKDSATSGKNTPLVDNYRPIQALNERTVYKSYLCKPTLP